MHRSCFRFYSMQNSSCWWWYLKGENCDSDTKNCMNTSLNYEDLNAQEKENSKCVHNLPFLFYAITFIAIYADTCRLQHQIHHIATVTGSPKALQLTSRLAPVMLA